MLHRRDTTTPETSRNETEADPLSRIAWEAAKIAGARAERDAGLYVDVDEIGVWIDSIGTDHEPPPPATRRS